MKGIAGIFFSLFLFLSINSVFGADGDLLWEKVYDGGFNDESWSIAIDSQNNIIVAGYSHNGSNQDYHIIKYGPNGNVIWEK
ncbi:MAG TPA: hypothetical protein HA367_07220, partial [Candidatus Methanofastidiosum sp.]|nr:hypothetical protein [Methanofastidiosum sp.]